ncbi:MAG: nuclear transport factor 2 family protein [Haliea sp.]
MPRSDDLQRDAVNELAARQAIRQCIATHSRGVDRADRELLCSAYHENATVDYGFFTGAAMDMAQILVDMQRQGPVTLHRPSNVWIRINGQSAISESYVIAYAESAQGDTPQQSLIGGRYLDRHEKRNGLWRLVHRTYVLDWHCSRSGTTDRTESSIGSGHFVPFGAHGAQDPGSLLLALQFAGQQQLPSQENVMQTMTDGDLDTMISRQAIEDLLLAYCRGVDRGDAELLASVFHDDATVISGVINGSAKDFARDIVAWCGENTKSVFHTFSNQWIEISGDSAVGEAYVMAAQLVDTPDGVITALVGGRYLDRFERRAGMWKIAQHTFVMDWNLSQPAPVAQGEDPFAAMLRGGRKPNDPLYEFWPA